MSPPASSLMSTYANLPVHFVRGQGCQLWDAQGKEYLDALAGIAVCGLGHCHPNVTHALQDQAETLVHTSNVYQIELQEALAQHLTKLTGMTHAFFSNSGAEANECALKMARLHGNHKQIENPKILVTENAFHGRTLLTLSASSGTRVREGFAPLIDDFVRVPFNDLAAARSALEQHPQIVAILVEPIQGEGGIHVADDAYLADLRNLCDAHDALLIFDEVQCGMGRTGRFLASQHAEVVPDIVTLAKALGNGFPIGACLAQGPAAKLMAPGQHGSTFGGNPLGCRAALSVLETLENENLYERAAHLGTTLRQRFEEECAPLPHVRNIRGRGLMIGIELAEPAPDLVAQALDAQLLINVTQARVIRLLPPLIMNDAEAESLGDRLIPLVKEMGT